MQNDSGSESQCQEEEHFQIGDSENLNNDTYQSQEDSCREEPQENPAKANKSSSQSKMNSKK